jgi:hypothetical protein
MNGMRVTGLVVLVALAAGCASGPRATGTAAGAAAGAAAGGLIGSRLGSGGGNAALIGAGLGALLGMLMGDAIQQQQQRDTSPAPTSRPPTPGSSSRGPAASTKGELINATTWSVRVYIDPSDPDDLEKATPILIRPVDRVSWGLDAGQHRIVAHAYDGTQHGERLVGRFDRTIRIETQRAGWFLEFGEEDFR